MALAQDNLEQTFLCRLLQPGWAVVDAGADRGRCALALAKRLRALGQGGRVLAIESDPEHAEHLALSITANALADVLTLRRLVLGEQAAVTPTNITTTLDALTQDAIWPPDTGIDLLRLDLGDQEPLALRGAKRLLRAHDPLLLLKVARPASPDTPVRQMLAHHGYQCYRLIPGLDALLALDERRALDPFDTHLFACKPERAAQLAAAGWLYEQPLGRIPGAPPPLAEWASALANLPYVAAVKRDGQALSAWQQLDRHDDPHWPDYELALNAYLSASDPTQPLPVRAAWLVGSLAVVQRLRERGDEHLATRLLHIRVLADAGERAAAAHAIQALVEAVERGLAVRLDRPFVPPLAAYDQRAPVEGIAGWLNRAIQAAEQRHRGGGFDDPLDMAAFIF